MSNKIITIREVAALYREKILGVLKRSGLRGEEKRKLLVALLRALERAG